MGTHHGLIAARCSKDAFVAALRKFATAMVQLQIPSIESGPDDGRAILSKYRVPGIYITAQNDITYALDTELVICTDADLLGKISAEVNCLLASGFAEGASVTGGLIVIDRGQLRRSVFLEPESDLFCENIGEPFPTEAAEPIDGHDGIGQWTVLKSLGFDPDAWEAARGIELWVFEEHLKDPGSRKHYARLLGKDDLSRGSPKRGWLRRVFGAS